MDLIEILKQGEDKLSISEVGYGCKFSNNMMQSDGVSSVLEMVESPYGRGVQKYSGRAVSQGAVRTTAERLLKKGNTTVVVATSFQAGREIDSHGYIAIYHKTGYDYIYHVTLGKNKSKEGVNILVNNIIKDLLLFRLTEDTNCLSNRTKRSIDGVFGNGGVLLLDAMENFRGPFGITKGGGWCRVTELVRDEDNVNVIKGSFNPSHNGHTQMIITDRTNIFMLNGKTVQGKKATVGDLYSRVVRMVQKNLDAYYIISPGVFGSEFKNCTTWLQRLGAKSITFSIGTDVYNLIEGIENIDADFKVYVRSDSKIQPRISFHESVDPGLSSTQIRKNAGED